MTQDEIIEMARQAGYPLVEYEGKLYVPPMLAVLLKTVTEAERETCAKLCDLAMLQNQEAINELDDDEHIAKCFIQGAMTQLVKTSKAIRARGEQHG